MKNLALTFVIPLFFPGFVLSQEQFRPYVENRINRQINYKLPLFTNPQNLLVEVVDGHIIFEGDIILYREDQHKDAGIEGNNFRWEMGEIPYEIEGNHPQREDILEAIRILNETALICVIPRNGESDYVEFIDGRGCASFVGRQGGRQDIIIGGCSLGSIQHEILHAAGMFHEQSRSDRDNFVTINFDNIQAGRENNFRRVDNTISFCPYDFGSIMHYSATAFSRNGLPTITPINPLPPGVIMGQRNGLSQCDIDGLTNLYPNASNCNEQERARVWLHNSKGSEFEYRSNLQTLAGFWDSQKWIAGDFNGDGKDDLVNLYGSKGEDGQLRTRIWVHQSTGSRFEYQSSFQTLAGFWDSQKWIVGDFNGDGKDDLVNLYGSKGDEEQEKARAWVHLSTGSGFEYRSSFQTLAGFWDNQKWLVGDFNGDGKEDLVNLYGSKGDDEQEKARAWVHLSTGSGFEYRSSFQTLAGFWDNQKWLAGDFNGDGMDDLVNLYGSKGEDDQVKATAWVHLSTGSGFEYRSSFQTLAGFWDNQKWLVGDFNGDGKDDLVNLYGGKEDDGQIKTRAWIHHSTGSGFEYRSSFQTLAGFWDTQKWLIGDFNDDDKYDLVNLYGRRPN